jgi:hypothetical protein
MSALRKDVAFLKSQRLMDYSLLIVIEKSPQKPYLEASHNSMALDRYSLQTEARSKGKLSINHEVPLSQ